MSGRSTTRSGKITAGEIRTPRVSKRGEYSPIIRALRDEPDYQRLTPIGRHVFLDLKVMFGPSGIEVHYPAAIAATLGATTGWSIDQVNAALDELETAGLIDRQENVIWIVQQLEHHPLMVAANKNHRVGIQSHVNGLPSLEIVGRFTARYDAFFQGETDGIEGHSKAIPMALEGHSKHAVPSTRPNTQYPIPTTKTNGTPVGDLTDPTPKKDADADSNGGGRMRQGVEVSHDVAGDEGGGGVHERQCAGDLAKGAHGFAPESPAGAAENTDAGATPNPAEVAGAVAEAWRQLNALLGRTVAVRIDAMMHPDQPDPVATFVAGVRTHGQSEYAWLRALIDFLEPTGGHACTPTHLIAAVRDFNASEYAQEPYSPSLFRGFVRRAVSAANETGIATGRPGTRSTSRRAPQQPDYSPTVEDVKWQN